MLRVSNLLDATLFGVVVQDASDEYGSKREDYDITLIVNGRFKHVHAIDLAPALMENMKTWRRNYHAPPLPCPAS